MLARYAVLPPPARASGSQVLLLSKLKAPLNHAESTLLQVFFLKNLKPFGINTYEKQGEGSPLWLTNCSKKVSARNFAGIPAFHLPYTLPSSVSRNPFICHSYENTGGVGVFFPFRNSSYLHSRVQREIYFFFLATRHPPLATFFPNASSTGAAMISRTRSRRAGTSSFVKPLVSIVSCKYTVILAGHSIQCPVRWCSNDPTRLTGTKATPSCCATRKPPS